MNLSQASRRRALIVSINLLTFLFLLFVTEMTAPAKRSDLALQDMMLVNWPPIEAPPPPQVALVTITETTLARLPYRSPIDRELLAQIVGILGEAGVSAMAFDILFDQTTEPAKDQLLADAMVKYQGQVIIAWADHRGGLLEQQSAWLEDFIARSGAIPGFANLTTDADGVARRFEHHLPETDNLSLAAAVLKASGRDVPFPKGRIVWRAAKGEGAQAFQTLPAPGLLALGKVRPAALKALLGGKIVLIGADLPLVDRHTSSLAASLNPAVPQLTAGVEIHAHIVDQMINGYHLLTPDEWQRYVLLAVLALAASLLAVSGLNFFIKCFGLVALTGVYGTVAVWALYEYLVLMPLTQPLFITLVMFAATLSVSTLFLSSDRKFIRDAFGHYISPKLVAQMIDNPDILSVGGERKDLSFIFSDIAGFTSLSEAIEPERLTSLLNDYLGGMSELVVKHNGIVDKFIGDAVVAIFGAPGDDPDHRQNALNCALEMESFCQTFVEQNSDVDMGVTRIGVHSGDAIVGNFGGEGRYDYTAMGDTMNIAARLESANKTFGTRLAVSGNTLQFLKGTELEPITYQDRYLVPLGEFIFKGKEEPVAVATPLLHHDGDWAADCGEMIKRIAANDVGAGALIDELYERHRDEPVVAFHKHRYAESKSGFVVRLMDK